MDEDKRELFAAELAQRRAAQGLSLARLSARAHTHRAHLQRLETGQRWPPESLARLLDDALRAHGVLLAAWRAGEADRLAAAQNAKVVAHSVRESRALDVLLDVMPIGEAVTAAEQAAATLAVDYLGQPPAPMLTATLHARTAAVAELQRAPASDQRRDLIRATGHLSGVLAYAALDLGHPRAAAEHAATALRCAQTVGDSELAAWVRGTQSLIARFVKDYSTALRLAQDGLEHAGAGSSVPRLLSGVAQSAANLGDDRETHRALNAAEAAADRAGQDSMPGLFTFSRAKGAYYEGSALSWLDQPADARRAIASSAASIALWRSGDPADRSLDDEALAHVYAATAHVQLREVDAAAAMLAPVLGLPAERRISWLRNRVGRIQDLLAAPRFAASPAAGDLRVAVEAFQR